MASTRNLKELGEAVRKLRQQRDLSQVEFARAADVDRSYLSSLESGTARSFPKRPTLEKLARALRVNPEVLLGRTPEPAPTPYDRDKEIRAIVDGLVDLPQPDRAEIIRHTMWSIERARASAATLVDGPRQDETGDETLVGDSDTQRLVAAVMRLSPEVQRQFFQDLADKDAFDILSIRSTQTPIK